MLAVLLVLLLGTHHPLMGGMPGTAMAAPVGAWETTTTCVVRVQCAVGVHSCPLLFARVPEHAPKSAAPLPWAGSHLTFAKLVCSGCTRASDRSSPRAALSSSRRQALLGILRR
jgi:hypothetical protein